MTTTLGIAAPALATDRVIERSGCLWRAGVGKYQAFTKRASPNDCAGHGWVRIWLNGASGYTAWTHSADTFDGAVQTAPVGRYIVRSQHTTCSGCSAITLVP